MKVIFESAGIRATVTFFLALMPVSGLVTAADEYRAEIVYTEYGIPHITADDFGSLGYGEGYAAARDQACNIADTIITTRGEQALYFGAGDNNAHAMSDALLKALQIPERAKEVYRQQPAEIQEWLAGFAAGFNRYIHENGATSWCKDAGIVQEITPEDIVGRGIVSTQTLALMGAIVLAAQPPAQKAEAVEASDDQFAMAAEAMRITGLGSNGWAFGKERTENGRGMLLANPHYPWDGVNRFWEKHLIIPGKLNVYGAGLMGAPGVVIGFNENVGWTHTVSNSQRVAVYKLNLVPGKPTSYYYDGKEREMTSRTVDVSVKGDDGKVSTKSFTIWFSHYGPMISMPGLGWTDKVAFTVRDINAENVYTISQWLAMATSKNMDEFKEANRKWNAMPWVNTVATSKDGRAVYLDNSNVGNLSDEAIELWQEKLKSDPLTKMVFTQGAGMPLLDGSDSRFEFQIDPSTTIKGTVPYERKPQMDRDDYVFNCNDNYWLSNVEHPLTGYSPLYGLVETARSVRTRECAKLVSDTSPTGHAGQDGKFTIQEIQDALFANESLTAQLLVPELVDALTGVDSVVVSGETVDLREARAVLAEFNGHLDLDSKGAVLFREWLMTYNLTETLTNNQLFKVPFDPADPVNTPRGLGDKKIATEKVGHAVQVLKRAGLKLDATLGETQFAYRNGTPYPVHGGGHHDGIANLQATGMGDWRGYKLGAKKIEGSPSLTDKGYPVIHGSSFILTLTFDDNGPVGEALLSYSQSDDPASEHYADQTKLYSEEKWRPVRYKAEDIKMNAVSTQVLTGARN